jgi:hypothetical protein
MKVTKPLQSIAFQFEIKPTLFYLSSSFHQLSSFHSMFAMLVGYSKCEHSWLGFARNASLVDKQKGFIERYKFSQER